MSHLLRYHSYVNDNLTNKVLDRYVVNIKLMSRKDETMAKIIDFRIRARQKSKTATHVENNSKMGQIILFSGVRVEHDTPIIEPSKNLKTHLFLEIKSQ